MTGELPDWLKEVGKGLDDLARQRNEQQEALARTVDEMKAEAERERAENQAKLLESARKTLSEFHKRRRGLGPTQK